MKKIINLFILTLFICIASGIFAGAEKVDAKEKTLLVTTFPIYQIVRNVTQGCDDVKVNLMLPGNLGCPHDYIIRPQDMQKLAKADVLIINGLGMEAFLSAFLKKADSQITIIDSSLGIEDTFEYFGEHLSEKTDSEIEHHDHNNHNHTGINPHIFTSPRMSAKLSMNIASELSKTDPANAAIFLNNAKTYTEAMNRLADEMVLLGKNLKNNRIVQPHDIFDYLARDMGLEIVAVMQIQNQRPSASEMLQLVNIIREKQAGAIFTEPQYPENLAITISKETGIPIIKIDPVASGPENAPLDYYETIMRKNIKNIELCLGAK